VLNIFLRINEDKHPELYRWLSSIPSNNRAEFVRQVLFKYLQYEEKIEAFNNALSSLDSLNEKINSIQQSLQKLETLDDIIRLLNDISQKGVLSLSPSNSTVVQSHNNQQIDPFMEKLQKGIDQILSMGR